ncbi:MAG: hypothetical protein JXA36_03600 [Coriobacteriia bacterium]|nr:hypothetical protein [Coriobacteriia bacterium]
MAAEEPKPRFEPPPWEREAFERFRKEQEEERARRELEAALRQVREETAVAEEGAGMAPEQEEPDAAEMLDTPVAQDPAETAGAAEAVPEARIDAMLIQLRGEESPVKPVNIGLVNGVIGFMSATGIVILVQATLLFGDARSSNASATMLAATMSFMVFLTGLGFIGGAVMLFRKYHQ